MLAHLQVSEIIVFAKVMLELSILKFQRLQIVSGVVSTTDFEYLLLFKWPRTLQSF